MSILINSNSFSNKTLQHASLGFVVGIAVLLVFFSTKCGIVFTYDSYEYMASAKSFGHNGDFLRVDGSPNTIWAPLFSIVIACLKQSVFGIWWMNFLVVASTVVFTYLVAKKIQGNGIWPLLTAVFVGWHAEMHMNYAFLWSEPLFVALLVGNIYFLVRYLENGNMYQLIVSILLGFLMCLQRNAGIFLVAGAAFYLFVQRKYLPSVLFFACSSLGWWAWNTRNFMISNVDYHPGLSEMAKGEVLVKENVAEYLIDTASWLFPNVNQGVMLVVGVMLLGFMACCVFFVIKQQSASLLFSVMFFYWVLMQFVEDKSFDEVQRYNSVLIPIFFIFFFRALQRMGEVFAKKKTVWMALVLFVSLSGVYNLSRTIKNVWVWNENSCEFGEGRFSCTD